MPVTTPTPWAEWLIELLCRLYRQYGGDCQAEFGMPPSQARTASNLVQLLAAAQSQRGSFTIADPAEREEFLKVVNALTDHLALPDNTLNASDQSSLDVLIQLWLSV